jgi:hypothetical protein
MLPVEFFVFPVAEQLFDDTRKGDAGLGRDALTVAFFDAFFVQIGVDPVGGGVFLLDAFRGFCHRINVCQGR